MYAPHFVIFQCALLITLVNIGSSYVYDQYATDIPYLDKHGFDELLKKPNTTAFVHAYSLSKNIYSLARIFASRSPTKQMLYFWNPHCILHRMARSMNCQCQKVKSGRTFTRKINQEEKLTERALVKEALGFINPTHLDGCEDVVLNEHVTEDALYQDDENEIQYHKIKKRRCENAQCSTDFKNVKRLCKKSFPTFLINHTTSMVIFHLNVDTRSKVALENFIDASTEAKVGLMGSVACNEWPDLCEQQNVHSWPEIWIYKNQEKRKQYTLPLDSSLISNTLHLLTQPAVNTLNSDIEFGNFLSGKSTSLSFNKTIPFVTTGFFVSSNDKEYKSFAKVADQLHGSYVFGAVFGNNAKSWLKQLEIENEIPTLITTRVKVQTDGSPQQHIYQKTMKFDEISIKSFVKTSSFPTVVELNSLTFPAILKRTDMLITAVFPNGLETKLYNNLEILAEQFTNVQFSYVDKLKEQQITCKIVKACRLTLPKMPIILAKTSSHIFVYQTDEETVIDIDNLKTWIQSVQDNSLIPLVTLKTTEIHTDRPLAWDYYDLIYGWRKRESSNMESDKMPAKHQEDLLNLDDKLKSKDGLVTIDVPSPTRIVDEL